MMNSLMKWIGGLARRPTEAAAGPHLIRITSRGERIVDPASIIRSAEAKRHLEDIRGLVESAPNPAKK